jgi:hypothetical protein
MKGNLILIMPSLLILNSDSGSNIQTDVHQVLEQFIPGLNMHMMQDCGADGLLILWSGPKSCLVTLRAFRGPGLISISIEYYRGEEDEALITFDVRIIFCL